MLFNIIFFLRVFSFFPDVIDFQTNIFHVNSITDTSQPTVVSSHIISTTFFNYLQNMTSIELILLLLLHISFAGDIIQENFVDSYNNLTLKTILMLKWAKNNCVNKGNFNIINVNLIERFQINYLLSLVVVKYIMKCDDDSFINVPNLIHVLLGGTIPVYKSTISYYDKLSINAKSSKNRLAENKYLLMGYKFCAAKPITDVTSKWYAPNYLYNGEVYPDYLSGTAYVMTFEAAERLYQGSLSTPLFHLEDVYLTGFVADRIKLKRTHHQLFSYISSKDHCTLRGVISQHQMTPMTIEMAYMYVMNLTIKCAVPEKNFMSHKLKLTQRKKCQ